MMLAYRIALLAVFASASIRASELPSQTTIENAIDHYIDAKLQQQRIPSARQADDATLIRRLTLDLIGRIPTPNETRDFLASSDPNKRALLVDRLMSSPAFVRHQANEFDAMLMQGTGGSIRPYLQTALEANRTWDQIFRELMLPQIDETNSADQGREKSGTAADFLRTRVSDIDKMTIEVSILFFGVNISCAQCHDHPLVEDWKQDHFFGMKSFLARTVETGGFVGEREVGLVKFQTTSGENKQARMMFLTGNAIDAPGSRDLSKEEEKKERDELEKAKKEKRPLPPPKFSARQQLVETALQPDNRDFFARSIVNRLWARVFGFGLVNPVDQMHSENPPSHPELLDWLARNTIENGYDLRRLIRGLVMSNAYSRSSRWDHSEEPPLAKYFAVARLRPLTPAQLGVSLRFATTDPHQFENAKPEDAEKRLEGIENAGRGLASLFEWPGDDFQVGIGEALLFSNGERIQKELLADGGDRLIGRLKQLGSCHEQIDLAFRSIMSRPPNDDEIATLDAYLSKRSDRPLEGLRQMVWALLSSPEFRFNY